MGWKNTLNKLNYHQIAYENNLVSGHMDTRFVFIYYLPEAINSVSEAGSLDRNFIGELGGL